MSSSLIDCPKCDRRATPASIAKYGSCAKCKPKAFDKKPIPKSLKMAVWEKTFGDNDEGKCRCGDRILRTSHHCGHKLAESKGGLTVLNNLESICASCNLKMRTSEMNEWYTRTGGIIDMPVETKRWFIVSDDEDDYHDDYHHNAMDCD